VVQDLADDGGIGEEPVGARRDEAGEAIEELEWGQP